MTTLRPAQTVPIHSLAPQASRADAADVASVVAAAHQRPDCDLYSTIAEFTGTRLVNLRTTETSAQLQTITNTYTR